MKKTAVFWDYKFSKLDGPWSRLVNLVINSLQKYVSVVDKDIDKGKKLYTKEFVKKDKDEYFEQLSEIPIDLIIDYIKNVLHSDN